MAEEHQKGKCIVCGTATSEGMVVCYRCFFNYDHSTYNRKALEKTRKPPLDLTPDMWEVSGLPSSASSPEPTNLPPDRRIVNLDPKELYELVEELPTRHTVAADEPQHIPRALPTLGNGVKTRKRPKSLFSSFSWLIDGS